MSQKQTNIIELANNFFADSAKNYSEKSLLRYPGGKSRGVAFISTFIPANEEVILSPFIGGGSLELFLASKEQKVLGYDIFRPLVEFWQCTTEDSEKLAKIVESYYPLSKEQFYLLQKNQSISNDKYQRAAIYYVLNRSSFSGSTLSGGMSPSHPRFTKSSITRLRRFYNPNIEVNYAPFEESLAKHPDVFAYLDPPYLIKSSLYGYKGNAHKDFDHVKLANILRTRTKWILSYNECDEIRTLYKDMKIITPNWKYGMSNDKSSREVLIFSKDYKFKN